MNNLVIGLVIAATAALVWTNRSSAAAASRRELRGLDRIASAVEVSLRTERLASAGLQERLAVLRQRARVEKEALSQASAETRELAIPSDVANEGAWPAARAYFYLPKQYLATLGYGVFHHDGSLSDEAAQLFGLTPAEKVQLTDRWRQLRLELEQLQLQRAERLDPAQPDSDAHREISFRLPTLTNEVAQIKQQFQQELQTELGSTRGQLIWQKVAGENVLSGFPMGDEDRIITFTANRNPDGSVQHILSFANPSHTRSYQIPIQFDLQPNQALTTTENDGSQRIAVGVKLPLDPDSSLWNYRHLFGDQPLLAPLSIGH